MYREKSVGVVVPAYDEERLIGRVIETMPDYVDRIFVVDDCSRDRTCEVVEGYLDDARFSERLVLHRLPENAGVGAAIIAGYELALAEGIDAVAVMAGDAQMDPADLDEILDPVVEGRADYSKGNRLFTGDAWDMIPAHRYLGNAALSLLTKIASGYWHVADSQTGYTAISRRALEVLPLDRVFKRYGYPNHMLVLLNTYDFRVADVPVRPVYDIGERSGIRLWKVIPSLSALLARLFVWRMMHKYVIRDFHPLVFFYALGFGAIGLAFLFLLRILFLWPELGYIPRTSFLALTFLGSVGVQFTLFAMWFDMQRNAHLKEDPAADRGTTRAAPVIRAF